MKFISFGVLGLLAVAAVIPAAADSINLNTGNGSNPYIITADTLDPNEGTTATLVTNTATLWANDLSSEWIAPQADQSNGNTKGQLDTGSVTYDTTFFLPSGFTAASLSISFLADDWATISLNGQVIYPGPAGPDIREWLTDNLVADSAGIDSQLVSGLNTLEFVVNNTGGGTNVNGGTDAGGGSTGLNAQVSVNYSTSAVPEPSAALPLALAVLIAGFLIRRRQSIA